MGVIKLFDFKDWKKTQDIVDKLNFELKKNNKGSAQQLEVASRISRYKRNTNASSFLVFLLLFVEMIFFLAANIMMHFKLLTEFEREKLKYRKIYKIGITNREVETVVSKEIRIIFFLPVILGLFISNFYIYGILNSVMSQGINGIYVSLSTGFIYICFQILMYIFYKKYYIKKLTCM